jgi:hypothetical protein
MNIYIPFTYIIGWSKHKKFYYGCKYAKNCQPSDLWTTYFTSSDYVKEFREENGEPDIIKIHRTFTDKDSCILFEQQYLTKVDARNNLSFLNKTNGNKIACNDSEKARKTALKMVEERRHNFLKKEDGSSIGRNTQIKKVLQGNHHFQLNPPNRGRKFSEEWKQKLKKPKPSGFGEKMSRLQKGRPAHNKGKSKNYYISPDNQIFNSASDAAIKYNYKSKGSIFWLCKNPASGWKKVLVKEFNSDDFSN